MNKDKVIGWIDLQIRVLEKRIKTTSLSSNDIDYYQGQINILIMFKSNIELHPEDFE